MTNNINNQKTFKVNPDFTQLLGDRLNNNANISITENGAVGYKTTFNSLLDFSFKLTSYRDASQDQIVADWMNVMYDHSVNNLTKLKFSFYVRDILEGLGERNTARTIWAVYCHRYPKLIAGVLCQIPKFGRWDDLLLLHGLNIELDPLIVTMVKDQLDSDIANMDNNKSISLLAKWMPSVNSHCKETRSEGLKWAKLLNMTERQYRKTLSKLRNYLNIVEKNLSSKTYEKIDYSAVPSKASLKYKKAFMNRDEERYQAYLTSLTNKTGNAKINVATTMPHEILHEYIKSSNMHILGSGLSNYFQNLDIYNKLYNDLWKERLSKYDEDPLLEAAWNTMLEKDSNIGKSTLVVCDSSGSMTSHISGTSIMPIEISNALAIYFAGKLTGPYKDKFITFSVHPKWVDLSDCESLKEKIIKCSMHSDCSNTNIEATFREILNVAVENKLSQEELPQNILIISDMEFDEAVTEEAYNRALFETIGLEYAKYGYKLPRLIFNNVTSRTNVVPIKTNENGLTLISGFSTNIIKQIMSEQLDPWENLLDVLYTERYAEINCDH